MNITKSSRDAVTSSNSLHLLRHTDGIRMHLTSATSKVNSCNHITSYTYARAYVYINKHRRYQGYVCNLAHKPAGVWFRQPLV